MLHHGAPSVPKAAVDRQSIHANRYISDTLHHRAGEAHVFSSRYNLGVVDVVAVVAGIPVVLHDEARLTISKQEFNALILVLGLSKAAQLENTPGL